MSCQSHYVAPGVSGYSCPDPDCDAVTVMAGTVRGPLVNGGARDRRADTRIPPRPAGSSPSEYVKLAHYTGVLLRRSVRRGREGDARGAAVAREAALKLAVASMGRGIAQ